jgi:MATE family multidrug resistance protein
MFQAYKQFADGKSETKYSMWATIIANVVNVVVNYFLIFGIWIFPEMGIVGAAIGTIASRIVMLIYMHFLLKNNSKFTYFLSGFKFDEVRASILRKIIALGSPSAMQMFFEVALFTGAIWLSGMLGTTSQAANQIALSLASFTFMFAMGFSVAAMIRVGNQLGERDFLKLRVVSFSNFLLVMLLQSIFAILFVLFHTHLPYLFLEADPLLPVADVSEVVSIASKLLLIAALFQLSDGLQVVVLGALRGLQDVKIPMYITFIAYWMVGFPISIYLGLYTQLKAVGIWIGLFAGLTVAGGLLFWRFHILTKRLIVANA